MNKVLIALISMLIVGATMVGAQGAERELPVGKEISVAVHEILIQHIVNVTGEYRWVNEIRGGEKK